MAWQFLVILKKLNTIFTLRPSPQFSKQEITQIKNHLYYCLFGCAEDAGHLESTLKEETLSAILTLAVNFKRKEIFIFWGYL